MPNTPFYYIKAPVAAIQDDEMPDPVFRTLCKLLVSAREFRYWRTPKMTIHEMADLAGVSERTMWNHLSVLRQSVHVRVESPQRGHLVIHFPSLIAEEDLSAKDCTEGSLLSAKSCSNPVVDPISTQSNFGLDQQQHSSLPEGGVGGGTESAKVCTKTHPDDWHGRLACMDYLEVHEPKRSQFAADESISTDYLMNWVGDKQRHPERGGGFYVLQIEARAPAPSPRDILHPPEHLADLRKPVSYDEMIESPEEWEKEEIPPSPDARLRALPVDPSIDERTALQWAAVLGELALQMTQATYDTWLRGTELVATRDHTFVVAVKSSYAVDWLNTRLANTIRRTIHRLVDDETEVEFVFAEEWSERCRVQETEVLL
jgi:hypothetical protein